MKCQQPVANELTKSFADSRTGYPSLISLMVSVKVKHHVYFYSWPELRSCVKVEVAVLMMMMMMKCCLMSSDVI